MCFSAFSGSTVPKEEIRIAEQKFEYSRKLAWIAMQNVLENDVSCKRYAMMPPFQVAWPSVVLKFHHCAKNPF
jgi:hypothetical protein